MKEQKSVRAKEFSSRYVKICVLSAVLCVLVALAISFTVLKLTSGYRPLPTPDTTPTDTVVPATPEDSTTPPAAQTTSPSTTPTFVDPSKILNITKSEADAKYGNLVLVNDSHTFDPESAVKDLVIIREQPDRNITVSLWGDKVTLDTFKALCKMQSAMEQENDVNNIQLMTVEPYIATTKDGDGQQVANTTGEHSTGLAVNLKFQERNGTGHTFSDPDVAELYNWLKENAWKYGFIFRYPSSKQSMTGNKGEIAHLRYVGTVHSEYMYRYDLCLEEYLELIKNYNFNKPLTFEASDGNSYYIYHYAANESGDTNIPVRISSDTQSYGAHEISGTNCGGFVVVQTVLK